MSWVILALNAHICCESPYIPISNHKRILLEVSSSRHHSKILSDPSKFLNILESRIIVFLFLTGTVTLLAVEANDSANDLDEISSLKCEIIFLESIDTDAFGSAD